MADENVVDPNVGNNEEDLDGDTTFFEEQENDTTFIEVQEEDDRSEQVLMEIAEAVEKHGAQPALLQLINTDNNLGTFLDMDLSNVQDPVVTGKEMSAKIWEKIGERAKIELVDEDASTEAFHGRLTTRELKYGIILTIVLWKFGLFLITFSVLFTLYRERLAFMIKKLRKYSLKSKMLTDDQIMASKARIPTYNELNDYIEGIHEILGKMNGIVSPEGMTKFDPKEFVGPLKKMKGVIDLETGKITTPSSWVSGSHTLGEGGWDRQKFDSAVEMAIKCAEEWNAVGRTVSLARDRYKATKKVAEQKMETGKMSKGEYAAARQVAALKFTIVKKVGRFTGRRVKGLVAMMMSQTRHLG